MGARHIYEGRWNKQKRELGDRKADGRSHVQESGRTVVKNSEKSERMEWIQDSQNRGYSLQCHKREVATPMYLVIQVPN
jgi:hypothetical protein